MESSVPFLRDIRNNDVYFIQRSLYKLLAHKNYALTKWPHLYWPALHLFCSIQCICEIERHYLILNNQS